MPPTKQPTKKHFLKHDAEIILASSEEDEIRSQQKSRPKIAKLKIGHFIAKFGGTCPRPGPGQALAKKILDDAHLAASSRASRASSSKPEHSQPMTIFEIEQKIMKKTTKLFTDEHHEHQLNHLESSRASHEETQAESSHSSDEYEFRSSDEYESDDQEETEISSANRKQKQKLKLLDLGNDAQTQIQ